MREKHLRSRRRSASVERHHHHRHHHRDRVDDEERKRSRSPDDRDKRERKRSPDHRDRRRSPYDERDRRRSPEGEKKVCKRKRRLEEERLKEERIKEENVSPPEPKKNFKPREKESERWGKANEEDTKKKPVENIAKPDFGLSGKLAEEVNTFNGVVIKYAEPPEAGKPKRRWRLYPFKGDEVLPTLYIHRQSAYLIGRDRKVADLPVDHPSCSKQHAVLQYRIVPYTREDGVKSRRIRPYIIDLESANGTYINNNRIESKKYVELMERDVIKFAYSSREYVLLHEHSQDDNAEEDDNVNV